MGTIDEILTPRGLQAANETTTATTTTGTSNPPKSVGNVVREMYASGQVKPVNPANLGDGASATDVAKPRVTTYADLISQFAPQPMTRRQSDEEQRRYRRDQMINSLGSGLSALANVFFTTRGADNMGNGQANSVSGRMARYEQMLEKDRQNAANYFNLQMQAKRLDDANAQEEARLEAQARQAAVNLQLDLDEREAKARQQEFENRLALDKFNYGKEKDAKDRAADVRIADIRANGSSSSGNGRNGRNGRTVFSGGGKTVSIHDDVWEGSMQSVFDILEEELPDLSGDYDTAQKKEDFVKRNWWKSDSASRAMLQLSALDPADVESAIEGEVVDWTPEVEDYSREMDEEPERGGLFGRRKRNRDK